MKENDQPKQESNRLGGNWLGFSDPTPALPEGEGVRFEINKSVTANKAESLPTIENLSGVNKPFTSIEADSLPGGEGWGGVRKPRYITANPYTYPVIKDYRKKLKDHQTKAELVLWEYLRNKKTGHKIRRQHVIDDFIPDFVCLSKKVIIEIDGEIHKFQHEKDNMRTIRLNTLGYEVIRFTNDEVLNAPGKVAQKIKNYLNNRQVWKVSISPSFGGVRGGKQKKVLSHLF